MHNHKINRKHVGHSNRFKVFRCTHDYKNAVMSAVQLVI